MHNVKKSNNNTTIQAMTITDEHKNNASKWFYKLRDDICSEFEAIETELSSGPHANNDAGKFKRTPWDRVESQVPNDTGTLLQGGGEMSIMHGRVFEKVGVNVSVVHGQFSEEFREKIPGADQNDGNFWAAGISLVAHMQSPLVPAIHMNTRMIVTDKHWFGGGSDLNPMIKNNADTTDFHDALKQCCDRHSPDYYPEYKEWCDRYFYNQHRKAPRGVGGIFYDYLDSGNWDDDFAFTQDVGKTFLDIYPKLVRRHMHETWTDEQREIQLIKRGHYAEFNLVYDRGTQFGLKTGGNTEAILMSLPPIAKWP